MTTAKRGAWPAAGRETQHASLMLATHHTRTWQAAAGKAVLAQRAESTSCRPSATQRLRPAPLSLAPSFRPDLSELQVRHRKRLVVVSLPLHLAPALPSACSGGGRQPRGRVEPCAQLLVHDMAHRGPDRLEADWEMGWLSIMLAGTSRSTGSASTSAWADVLLLRAVSVAVHAQYGGGKAPKGQPISTLTGPQEAAAGCTPCPCPNWMQQLLSRTAVGNSQCHPITTPSVCATQA